MRAEKDQVAKALEYGGYSASQVDDSDELRISLEAGEQAGPDDDPSWPESDAAIEEIRRIVDPLGWCADWTGEGNDNEFDVAIRPRKTPHDHGFEDGEATARELAEDLRRDPDYDEDDIRDEVEKLAEGEGADEALINAMGSDFVEQLFGLPLLAVHDPSGLSCQGPPRFPGPRFAGNHLAGLSRKNHHGEIIMKCKAMGCKKTAKSKGYCPSHYMAWYRHKDDPNWTPEPLRGPAGQLGDEPLVQCPVWVPPQVADVIRGHRDAARKALSRLAERLLQKGVMRHPGRK